MSGQFSSSSKMKLNNLQALRGLAALMVFFHHFIPYLSGVYENSRMLSFGASGVDIFFVISGFIMVFTTAGKGVSAASFIWNRICRVVPPYWLVTFAMVALYVIGFHPVGLNDLKPDYIYKSALFIPFERNGNLEPIVAPGWTLNYEMYFYISFAVTLSVFKDTSKIVYTIGVLFLALSLSNALGIFHNFYAVYYSNPIIMSFVFGMLLANFHDRIPFGENRKAALMVSATLIVLAAAMLAFVEYTALTKGLRMEFVPYLRVSTWGVAGAALVLAAILSERAGLVVKSGMIVKIGNASFSLYLIHSIILHAMSKVAQHLHLGGWVYPAFIFVSAISITIPLSILMYKSFELPSGKALKHALPRFTVKLSSFFGRA